MRFIFTFIILFSSSWGWSAQPKNFFELSATSLSGETINFSKYKGKVVLVVNTASQCGFTPQLKELESLNKKYAAQGLVVLGFPSNDFKQEQAENIEVQKFAKSEYGVTFQLFNKAPVSGKDIQPVFGYLTTKKPGVLFKDVSWNFEKFLINRQGEVVERWSSITNPSSDSITRVVEKLLNEK